MSTVLCLMGPTASGKTDLAVMLAEKYPVSLISVDSAIIYQQMDIGAGKPSYPHALVNICDPSKPYSAAQFCQDALVEIEKAFAQKKLPCLVGGTMMYFKALQEGLAPLPSTDAKVRAKIQEDLQKHGLAFLWDQLNKVDPDSAARIHPNDPQRICRALEVYEITQQPLSGLFSNNQKMPYPSINIGLWPEDRQWLHARIEKRFQLMMEAGFLDEVQALYNRGDLHPDLPSIRCVGYRQLWSYLEGDISLDEACTKAIAATRQLAKRQITWLRGWDDLIRIDPANSNCFEELEVILKKEKWL